MKETLNPNTRYFETLHIIRFELSWANRLFQVRSESRSDDLSDAKYLKTLLAFDSIWIAALTNSCCFKVLVD